jgi:hypothetical protein
MAYPPAVPPNTRIDTTPDATNHPSDHNVISNALTDILNELGSGPKGGEATVTNRLAGSGWLTPVYQNSWVDYPDPGGSGRTVRYQKINGIVYFSGVMASGVTEQTAWILPVGFRPIIAVGVDKSFVVNNSGALGLVSIMGDGRVIAHGVTAPPYVFLDSIWFPTT